MNAYKVKIPLRYPAGAANPHASRVQDFSEGVRYMKQIKKTENGIEGNLNVMSHAGTI